MRPRREAGARCRRRGLGVTVGVSLLSSGVAFGCGVHHIEPYAPRERQYDVGEYEDAPEAVSEGSLWLESSRGLFADFRASRVGDLVTIDIDESARASGDANTALDREAEHSFGLPSFFGLTAALQRAHPNLDPSQLFAAMSQYGFTGDGETTRGSRVNARIAVRVKRRLPNGDLFVEGTKVILINDEELHVYVSGVVRPQDIEQDNSVRSSLVADAQIELTGRGALTDNQRQGWLSRLISKVRPF
ncbi:MAG: flagellar basal body L-ring protein FlgH [Sandaracinus sp.]|nr:flagellar basal body L-ring protein FlgH [Sandaracinus sp.]MCB9632475.1 flagellar basal body L-ring protein FlgH [Sandaracinus sp.]